MFLLKFQINVITFLTKTFFSELLLLIILKKNKKKQPKQLPLFTKNYILKIGIFLTCAPEHDLKLICFCSDKESITKEKKRPRKQLQKLLECTIEEVSSAMTKKKVSLAQRQPASTSLSRCFHENDL